MPSEDLLREQSFLVARGVRPMSLVEWRSSDPRELTRISTLLDRCRQSGSLPFVIDHGDGSASYGYAGSRWVVELYEWASADRQIPREKRDCILGLLLGYSVPSVADYEAEEPVRHFRPVAASESPGRAPSRPRRGVLSMGETSLPR
jgi:hypothetical protein